MTSIKTYFNYFEYENKIFILKTVDFCNQGSRLCLKVNELRFILIMNKNCFPCPYPCAHPITHKCIYFNSHHIERVYFEIN